MQRIPILEIVKQSLALPFSNPIEFLKAIGLFAIAFIVMAILMAVMLGAGGVDVSAFENGGAGMSSEEMLAAFLPMLPAILLVMLVMLLVTAHVFNFWVRAGAFGIEHAKFESFGQAVVAAGINTLKLFGLSLILGLASFLVFFILQALGLSVGFGQQMELAMANDIAGATKAGLMNQIIMTVVTCGVYSWASANLTQTAVGSEKEGLQHPHTVDFAIVLLLLYAIAVVPQTIGGLMGSQLIMPFINLALLLFVMLAVGVAHGIRYRICVAENEKEVLE